jgi:hypothetical protein
MYKKIEATAQQRQYTAGQWLAGLACRRHTHTEAHATEFFVAYAVEHAADHAVAYAVAHAELLAG